MNIIKLFILIFLSSCTTIAGRDLPIKSPPNSSSEKKLSLLIHSPRTKLMMDKKSLQNYFKKLDLFSQITVLEDYEIVDPKSAKTYDLELELDFVSGGFFEPYCMFLLYVIPCTPPLNWALGIKATTNLNKNVKTYIFKEDATEITWAFGFLLPRFGKAEVKVQDLKENMLNNLLVAMKEDHLIE